MLEDRDVHACDDGRSSGRSQMPLQAAEIVIHLSRSFRAKHKSGSFLENALDLRVESVAANDPFLRFKERAVCSVDFGDRDRPARGIWLAEYFEQVPFHQRTKCVAHR